MVPQSMRLSRSCAGVDWRQRFGPRMLAVAARIRRADAPEIIPPASGRSEEHTSELQSQSNLVCRLLLEKQTIAAPASTLARSGHPRDAAPSFHHADRFPDRMADLERDGAVHPDAIPTYQFCTCGLPAPP